MKLSSPFLALLTIVAFPLHTLADFHIFNCDHCYGVGDQSGCDAPVIAVPSNQYSCSGLRNNPVIYDLDGHGGENSDFSIPNLCGVAQINAYPRSSSLIELYINNGNGQVVGSCYPGGHGKLTCPAAFDQLACSDDWVCYTYICS
ncbi:hypothetical protein BDQ12DRAFT_105390 [Crucibulum laeve]|uniref:Uncharacterized protein n=1 Tax=Crucibulum laeve TaxID=68775 RepID=A0A5C3LS92_9AGAR|nr:hypothetical protein BDQ12DRAFT_105390 [Crucibulum laeve]